MIVFTTGTEVTNLWVAQRANLQNLLETKEEDVDRG